MAILGGLFSSKKEKRNGTVASSTASEIDTESIAGTEYDPHSPPQTQPNSVYLNAGASTSKLKLAFRRKKSNIGLRPPALSTTYLQTPALDPFASTRSADVIRPPPSRSELFGAFGNGEGAQSTRSLPNVSHTRTESHDSSRTAIAPPPVVKKSGGLFSWARERKKSKAPPPPTQAETDASFNLKSFRHVQVDSPTDDPGFPIPPARPRGDSVTSESSQRISVAAFREMQARRSAANSPTPSASPRPTPISDNHGRTGSPNLQPPKNYVTGSSSQTSLKQPAPRVAMPPTRKSMLRSSSSSESPSEESNSDDEPLGMSKAKSEMGHSSSPMASPITRNQPRPPMPNDKGLPPRPRASASSSAAIPNTAAKQASASFKAVPPLPPKRNFTDSETSESDSEASSEDDAPLSTLVGPRRPGSAMSTATNRTLPKPLIDINSITSPSSVPSSAVASPAIHSARLPQAPPPPKKDTFSPTNVNDRLAKVAQGISTRPPLNKVGGAVSEAGVTPTEDARGTPNRSRTAPAGSTLDSPAGSPLPKSPPARTPASPEHRVTKSVDAFTPPTFMTNTSTAAPSASTSSSSFEKLEYSPKLRMKRASLCLDDTSTPIVPKPIHHRAAPAGFSVTSRPNTLVLDSISSKPDDDSTRKADLNHKKQGSFDFSDTIFSSMDIGSLDFDQPSASSTISTIKASAPKPTPAPGSNTVRMVSSASTRDMSPPNLPPASKSVSPPPVKRPTVISSVTASQPVVGKKQAPAPLSKPSLSSTNTNSTVSTPTSASRSHASSSPTSSYRPKPATLVSMVPDSPTHFMPPKPFASNSQMRGNSPASSTGDSSSGRGAPVTPRDGSEIGSEHGTARGRRGPGSNAGGPASSNGASNLNVKKVLHRKSSSYDDRTMTAINSQVSEEAKRKERRRSEAKNAIELGNVMNKPIRLNDNEQEEMDAGMGVDPRMTMFNPMMGMGMQSPGLQAGMGMGGGQQWYPPMQQQGQQPMMQQFMVPQPPPGVDPHYFAAHQQAMMVAKQAYQYAVAQQAMAAAADEWERGSSASMLGGGGGNSVWGGSNTGSMMFPSGPRSMYAGSAYGGSEVGGPSSAWGSSSVYGGSFGPSPQAPGNRTSIMSRGGGYPPMPTRSESAQLPSSAPTTRPGRPRTKTAPPENQTSRRTGAPFAAVAQEQARARGRTPPPPSSWKRS